MLRDVFLGDVPRIFKPSSYYAVCAVAGSAAYYGLVAGLDINKYIAAVVMVVVTVGLRRWSLAKGATTPHATDLTPKVAARLRRYRTQNRQRK